MSSKSTTGFKSNPIWTHDPETNTTINVQPLIEHLNEFASNPQEYAQEIDDVMNYMIQGLRGSFDEENKKRIQELHFMLRKMRDAFRDMTVKV